MELNSSFDQTNFVGYCPPSPNDYSNGGWKYHHEMTNYEQSTQRGYAPEPQNDQANHMRYCLEPQNDLCHYPHGAKPESIDSAYSTYQEPSSLEHTFNSFMQNFPTLPPSFSYENSSSLDYAST
ncbi:hypothetical protein AHAS_Ahas16G0191600 [Arachis hypogaea]